MSRSKSLYSVRSNIAGIVTYRNLETGEKGVWDTYRQTEKDLSRLPPPIFYIVLRRLRKNLRKYGRRINAILIAFIEAGIECGFNSNFDKGSSSVAWKVNVDGKLAEYARFAAFNRKWKEDSSRRRMGTKNMRSMESLMTSPAFLRFRVDTGSNRKVRIHCFEKRNLQWNFGPRAPMWNHLQVNRHWRFPRAS
jgi:hypothetical protein